MMKIKAADLTPQLHFINNQQTDEITLASIGHSNTPSSVIITPI